MGLFTIEMVFDILTGTILSHCLVLNTSLISFKRKLIKALR